MPTYRQLPVAFCADGGPLLGSDRRRPPGLWSFRGFSGPFANGSGRLPSTGC